MTYDRLVPKKKSKTNTSLRANELNRQQRVAAMRKEAAAKERSRRLLTFGGIGVVVLAVIVAIVTTAVSRGGGTTVPLIPGLVTYDISKLGRNHVTGTVKYSTTPPVGGDHNPVWLNCGIYTAPVPNENAVHDLEHGAVWITYDPALPATEVAKLQAKVRAEGTYQGQPWTTLSPYPGLPSGVIYASAWGYQLKLDNADDPRLDTFLKRFVHGKQDLEPTSPCSGGTGTPVP